MPGAWITDPFGNAGACVPQPLQSHYTCALPQDLALRVNPAGLMLGWDTSFMHTGVEVSCVALAGVLALVVVLPYSKEPERRLGLNPLQL